MRKIVLGIIIIILVALGFGIRTLIIQNIEYRKEYELKERETENIEKKLTKDHGDEAKSAITMYEKLVWSPEGDSEPEKYYKEVLTGSELARMVAQQKELANVGARSKIREIYFSGIRVIEYSDKRMVVVSCEDRRFDNLDNTGNKLPIEDIYQNKFLYYFLKDDGKWKVAYASEITVRYQAIRDWNYYTARDVKQLTDDFETLAEKDCLYQRYVMRPGE